MRAGSLLAVQAVGYNDGVMTVMVILIVLQLIYLEGILSLDNAALLGSMVAHLPSHEAIPWPRPLRAFQKILDKTLGGQRAAALEVGLLGAYLGRAGMLLVASWVIHNRWLLLLGGLYIVKLAVDHLGETPTEARAARAGVHPQRSTSGFWNTVLRVEFADVAFSLDNVVAAVALSRQLWVVLTGVFLGVITMRFAAGIFGRLLRRYPVLEATAYILVLIIGVELLLEDLAGVQISDVRKFAVSIAVLTLALLYDNLPGARRAGQRMRWLKRGLGLLELLFGYLMKPVTWMIFGLGVLIRAAVAFPSRRHAERIGDRVDGA